MLSYQILAFTRHGKIQISHIKIVNLRYQVQHGMLNLHYMLDHIMYQISGTILSKSSKNVKQLLIILQ